MHGIQLQVIHHIWQGKLQTKVAIIRKNNILAKTIKVFDFPEEGGVGLAMYNTKEVYFILNNIIKLKLN